VNNQFKLFKAILGSFTTPPQIYELWLFFVPIMRPIKKQKLASLNKTIRQTTI